MVDAELEHEGLQCKTAGKRHMRIEMEARDKHLLAGVGLLAGGNSVSHALQTLRLVLLGLGLVP